jgi:hypothetical protein
MDGWWNLDRTPGPGVTVCDIEQDVLPFTADSVEEMLLSHVLEHIKDPLGLMENLYRVAKPGCRLVVRCPYGSSDDAWEDPTHVRPYFMNSFLYFSQPAYWRADYGYRGDWQVRTVTLRIPDALTTGHQGRPLDAREMLDLIAHERNIVTEMIAELEAIKPAREGKRELQEPPRVQLAKC